MLSVLLALEAPGGVMDQVAQIAGALLLLSAFALSQARLLSPRSLTYLLLNAVGSGVLAVLAWRQLQWGFLLLEGVWALVSLVSIIRLARGADPGPSPH